MKRSSRGQRIELSARDVELFRLLTRYRYLRSTYLHAFVGGASETRFKERLGNLFHEGYLDRPREQWDFANGRHSPAVHEIGKRGLDALRALGKSEDACARSMEAPSRQFLHRLMICEALASVELAARATDGLRFIAWPEILARAPTETQNSSAPMRLPTPSIGAVIPDGVFGLEYEKSGIRTYRFFALEADRGTMPVSRSKPGQTSYLSKLGAYKVLLGEHAHKTRWGIPNLLVLTLTTSATRVAEIIAKIGIGSPAFLFKFVGASQLTKPMAELLSEPWRRAGHESMRIESSF